MKLSILLAGSILTSAITGNVYAQTCGAQPSCADLGYTLTSTADCIGTPLKCPFDKTKYNCVTQNDIVPKWEGSYYLDKWGNSGSGYNSFTMAKAGCVLGVMGGKGERYFVRVNSSGGTPAYSGNAKDMPVSYEGNGQFFFCLKKGETFTLTEQTGSWPRDFRFRVMYYK